MTLAVGVLPMHLKLAQKAARYHLKIGDHEISLLSTASHKSSQDLGSQKYSARLGMRSGPPAQRGITFGRSSPQFKRD